MYGRLPPPPRTLLSFFCPFCCPLTEPLRLAFALLLLLLLLQTERGARLSCLFLLLLLPPPPPPPMTASQRERSLRTFTLDLLSLRACAPLDPQHLRHISAASSAAFEL
ncbi:uncharacterized protein BKA78DRAFT_307295 [Phyllosticta capitalensis]|uniref:uncharacterized protein n=1 Tax=Phyllosticta capitalensis TaxID=121624 RepID=UPI0031306D24